MNWILLALLHLHHIFNCLGKDLYLEKSSSRPSLNEGTFENPLNNIERALEIAMEFQNTQIIFLDGSFKDLPSYLLTRKWFFTNKNISFLSAKGSVNVAFQTSDSTIYFSNSVIIATNLTFTNAYINRTEHLFILSQATVYFKVLLF